MFLRPSPLVFLFTFCLIIIIAFTLLFSALLISENDRSSPLVVLNSPDSPSSTESPPSPSATAADLVDNKVKVEIVGKNTTSTHSSNLEGFPPELKGIASKTLILVHFPNVVTEADLGMGLKSNLQQWHSLGLRMFSLYPTDDLEEFKRINNSSSSKRNSTTFDNNSKEAFGMKQGIINYFPVPGNLSRSQQSLALLYATVATVQDFDWVIKVSPDTLVRLVYLLALLSKSNSRIPLLLGQPDPRPTAFQPMTFCKAAPGMVFSAGLLRHLGTNLLQCFQHIAPPIPEEAAWAECLHYFAPKDFPGCSDGEAGRVGWTRFVDLHAGQLQGEWWRDVELKVAGRLDTAVMIGGADEVVWQRYSPFA